MKSPKRTVFLRLPVAPLVAVLMVLALHGRARAQLDLQPGAVVLQGERGGPVARTVALSSPVAVKDLRCVLHELIAQRPDKSEMVLPRTALTFTCPDALVPGNPKELRLEVQKLDGLPSGEYSGELVLLSVDAATGSLGQHKLAIKVRVRDRWPLAAGLLIFSVLASVGLSVYRSTGKPRDELLVRLGPVRAAVQSDKELNQPYARAFAELFARHIGDVEQALIAVQWNDAQQALARAEAALGRWSRHRRTWVELLHRLEDYRLAVSKARHSYPDATERWLTQLAEHAAQAEGPAELRESLEKFAPHAIELVALHEQLVALLALSEQGPSEQRPAASARYHELEPLFALLVPDDVAATRALRVKVEAALKEATGHAAMRRGLEMSGSAEPGPPAATSSREPPSDGRRISDQEVEGATIRQRSYTWMGYLFTVIVLGSIGYQELYENNPLFGARGLADYLTILLWGFGTEATRASVLGTVSGWGLPGIPGKPRE